MAGVSNRTRSKNVPLFRSLSPDVSFYSKPKRRKNDEDDKGLDNVSGFSSKTCSKSVPLFGVSSRTRSKSVPLFGCLSVDGSSKRRKSDEGEKGLDFASGFKKMKVKEEPFVVPENAKVIISIDDDDDDVKVVEKKCGLEEDNPISICSDEYGESDEEDSVGFGGDNEEEEKEEKGDDDVKEEVKKDESKGSGGNGNIDVKDENFVDEKCGLAHENVIIIDTDENGESDEEEEHSVGSDSDNAAAADDDDVNEGVKSDESGRIDEFADEDSDESEDDDSSDDFKVEELNEISDNDDDSSSDSPYVDEKEEKKKGYRKDFNVVEKLVREVMDRQCGISEKNNENSSSSTSTDHASVSSSIYVKKGSSSKLDGVSETLKAKSVDVKMKNVSDESVNVGVNAKSKDNVSDSDQGKDQYVGGVSSVQTKQENEVLWDELDTSLGEEDSVSKVNLLFKHI